MAVGFLFSFFFSVFSSVTLGFFCAGASVTSASSSSPSFFFSFFLGRLRQRWHHEGNARGVGERDVVATVDEHRKVPVGAAVPEGLAEPPKCRRVGGTARIIESEEPGQVSLR